MKIYTKTGDTGETSLLGGTRVKKYDNRIEACGSIDELNAHIGLAMSQLPLGLSELEPELQTIQGHLFQIGAALAYDRQKKIKAIKISSIEKETVLWLEQRIDEYSNELPRLKQFILPGGAVTASQFQVARSVCRRAERRVVELGSREALSPELLAYLNRLSDYLFTLARLANLKTGTAEILWQS